MQIKRDDERRIKAKEMYLSGFSIKDIAKEMQKSDSKINWLHKCYYWKKHDEWEKAKFRKQNILDKKEAVQEKYLEQLLESGKVTTQDIYALTKELPGKTPGSSKIEQSSKDFYSFLKEQIGIVQNMFEERTKRNDLEGIEDAAKVLERLQKMLLRLKDSYIEFAGAFLVDLDEFFRNKGVFEEFSEHIFDIKDYVLEKYRNIGDRDGQYED